MNIVYKIKIKNGFCHIKCRSGCRKNVSVSFGKIGVVHMLKEQI